MSNIRPLELTDAPALFAAVNSSRDALRRWLDWYHDKYDLADAESWIRHTLAARCEGTEFHFAICESKNAPAVGVVGLEQVSASDARAMIGYWLATSATGRGLAKRAVADALRWARAEVSVKTVWAGVAEDNAASRRVVEANGFRVAGTRGIDERGDTLLLYEMALAAVDVDRVV